MRFCWSTLKVKNMEESLKFYEEIVGLSITRRFKTGQSMEIVFLGDGPTKVELIYDPNHRDINVGTDISWGFEVDCVENMMEFVKQRGIEIESGPFEPNPNTRFFYVLDPNGLKIQFVEHK
jgi:lactoylglutathione lyase